MIYQLNEPGTCDADGDDIQMDPHAVPMRMRFFNSIGAFSVVPILALPFSNLKARSSSKCMYWLHKIRTWSFINLLHTVVEKHHAAVLLGTLFTFL